MATGGEIPILRTPADADQSLREAIVQLQGILERLVARVAALEAKVAEL